MSPTFAVMIGPDAQLAILTYTCAACLLPLVLFTLLSFLVDWQKRREARQRGQKPN